MKCVVAALGAHLERRALKNGPIRGEPLPRLAGAEARSMAEAGDAYTVRALPVAGIGSGVPAQKSGGSRVLRMVITAPQQAHSTGARCKIVGWAMSDTMPQELTLAALWVALGWRDPQPGLLHHSDRGSQYAAGDYRKVLQARGITVSMSRKGDC